MNRVQREKAGWKFMTKAGASKGRWTLPLSKRRAPKNPKSKPAPAPTEPGDTERGPEPPEGAAAEDES